MCNDCTIKILSCLQYAPGMVDAAGRPNNPGFEDIVRIEIIAQQDGEISELKVKICREGIHYIYAGNPSFQRFFNDAV